MTFCLDTVLIKPQKDVQIKNAIILLHGYGGDGKDILPIQFLSVQMDMNHVQSIHLAFSGLI